MTMVPTATPRASVDTSTVTPTVDRSVLIRAIELQNQGHVDAAEQLLRHYLTQLPADPVALYSLAVIWLRRQDTAAALELLERAVKAVVNFPPLWFAHATVLVNVGRRDDALRSYQCAIDLKPDFADALINSGVLLRDLQQHVAALTRFQQVLALQPDNVLALANAATLLTEFKRGEEAVALLEHLVRLAPHHDYALGMLCHEKLQGCDWSGFEALSQQVIDGVRAGQRSSKSLGLMAISDSAEDHQRCARLFAQQRYPVAATPLWTGERYRHDRIRIAYVSPDLREHPVGHLMAGIFERHDKTRFETTGISLGVDDGSRLRERMTRAFDQFIDARQMTAVQIATLLRTQEIDIVVDLAGYTADSRAEIFTWRPAPVQVNFLGYPGTMGLACMDYILADRHVVPPDHWPFYDERVVYLPDAYLPPASGLQISEATPSRADCGLPPTGVVFCSFNHDYKILPAVFAVWMRLLLQVPGSVLWLMSRSERSQTNLRASARAAGVDPDRLVFAQRVPRVEDHLARYRLADLFLDTHPYNAHSTAADALLAGLPVLTCSGQSFPSRVAGSLLHAAGLPELVTHSVADYEQLALALARDPARLAALRARLGDRRQGGALFDVDGFTRHLETAYIAMWRQSQLGGARDALSAPALSA
ncbi:tetratricopeptide repeat protein [Sphaerotilus sp.]|uniref:O-linked N-acetylglucosamine transferase, SPINDLY family protein n=1 Tax=Sphaerotilus sp. TaxID=2093942 RepID=UPI00286E2DF5|nr:tetratricopeptide repeat protein [Sphaerotilus sp.]